MAGRKSFRVLTSSQQYGIQSKNSNTHTVQQIHITTTIHIRQLQQYTQYNYNKTHRQPTTITHKTT